jgi:hypothetical protein
MADREKKSDTTGFSRVEFQFLPRQRYLFLIRAAEPRGGPLWFVR